MQDIGADLGDTLALEIAASLDERSQVAHTALRTT
jgi:hypothetical protein